MLNAEPNPLRLIAIREAELGFAHIARAFNLCNNPDIDYYWDEKLKDQAMELLKQIQAMVEHGHICSRPISESQSDNAFQKFMIKVSGRYARRDIRN